MMITTESYPAGFRQDRLKSSASPRYTLPTNVEPVLTVWSHASICSPAYRNLSPPVFIFHALVTTADTRQW
jgi:hypothetical protein